MANNTNDHGFHNSNNHHGEYQNYDGGEGNEQYRQYQFHHSPNPLFIDVMSSDGVSTITGPLDHTDFDPIGVYLPIQPEPQRPEPIYEDDHLDYEEDDGQYDYDGVPNDYEDVMYKDEQDKVLKEGSSDFDPHNLGPENVVPVGSGYILPPSSQQQPHKQYSTLPADSRDYPDDSYRRAKAEQHNDDDIRDEYANRLEGWYTQMEQLAERAESTPVGTQHDEEDPPIIEMPVPPPPPPVERPSSRTSSSYFAKTPSLLQPLPPPPSRRKQHQEQKPNRKTPSPPPPLPSAPPELTSIRRENKNRRQRLYCYITLCILLIVVVLGAAFVAVSYFTDALPISLFNNEETDESSRAATLDNDSTFSPTFSPTTTIVLEEMELKETDTFYGSGGFGSSVAISARFLVIGSPSSNNVSTFQRKVGSSNQDESWQKIPVLTGSNNSDFGLDVGIVDLAPQDSSTTDALLLIGAPRLGVFQQGGAFLYRYINNNEWELQGEPAPFGTNTTMASFGTSVAITRTSYRSVIGAPGYGSNRGRVYTYFLASPMSHELLVGSAPNARFGQAVDIATDADTIAVTEPGTNSFYVFSFDGSDWIQTFSYTSIDGQEFGSSIVFLSNNYLAVGDPLFNNSCGLVQVFQKDNGGNWAPLPVTLTGNTGDRFGEARSIGGQEGSFGPELVIGTSNKRGVQRYDWVGGRWLLRFSLGNDDPITSVAALTKSDGQFTVLAGFGGISSAILYSSGPFGTSAPLSVQPTSNPGTTAATSMVPSAPPSVITYTSNPGTTAAPSVVPSAPPSVVPYTSNPGTTAAPSVVPSAPPSMVPSATPSVAPSSTSAPSSAPTPTPKWTMVGGPLAGLGGVTFGQSVALVNDFLFVGEPGIFRVSNPERGNVSLFQRSTNWNGINFNATLEETIRFGYSLYAKVIFGKPTLAIGAVDTRISPGSTRYGSAHYFEYGHQGWTEIGGTLRPLLGVFESGGDFGSSVAISEFGQSRRIVVGAQQSSVNSTLIKCGRIYTFDFDGISWNMSPNFVFGPREQIFLGASIDTTHDGTRMLAGSPGDTGGDGSFFYYDWSGSRWETVYSVRAAFGSLESLGFQVLFLTDDGNTFAVGSPNHNGDEGIIRIYERSGAAFQMTADIAGSPGEKIGISLSGGGGRIAYGTDLGTFHVLEYNGSGWAEISDAPPSLGARVISIAISDDLDTVAVGFVNKVAVFELQ